MCQTKCTLAHDFGMLACGLVWGTAEVAVATINVPGGIIGHVISSAGLEAAKKACGDNVEKGYKACTAYCEQKACNSGPPLPF